MKHQYKIVDTFGNFDNIVCRLIETQLSDGSAHYDVRVYNEDGDDFRDLACEDLAHAKRIFDAISTCL